VKAVRKEVVFIETGNPDLHIFQLILPVRHQRIQTQLRVVQEVKFLREGINTQQLQKSMSVRGSVITGV